MKDSIEKELAKIYPGKQLFKNSEQNPTEWICEVEPSSEHPEYSIAVAVIDKSIPHFHKKTTETYKVLKGNLTLNVSGQEHKLKEGETFIIIPNELHWAKGNKTWVECRSKPGWTPKDHVVVN